MNQEYLYLCKKEIDFFLEKILIREFFSPWSCTVFDVNNAAERERRVPHLVLIINPSIRS